MGQLQGIFHHASALEHTRMTRYRAQTLLKPSAVDDSLQISATFQVRLLLDEGLLSSLLAKLLLKYLDGALRIP